MNFHENKILNKKGSAMHSLFLSDGKIKKYQHNAKR